MKINSKSIKAKVNQAFSLVELLVVIAVIAIIAAVAIPNIAGITGAATDAKDAHNADEVTRMRQNAIAAGAPSTITDANITTTPGVSVTNGTNAMTFFVDES